MKFNRSNFLLIFLLVFCVNLSYAQKTKNKPPSKYEYQGPFYDGLARVKMNKKWGFIDSTGGVVVSPKYNEVGNFSDGLARVRMGQKWGLIDKSGKEIKRPMFDWIYDFENGKAKVIAGGSEGYIDRNGNLVQ
jgi:hypothetical protein